MNDVQDPTPVHSQGFGAAEDADTTRQSQHTQANDTPTDVNCNAVIARAQAETITLMGKNFEANADRRNKLADQLMGK
jgi:hypothetical protein